MIIDGETWNTYIFDYEFDGKRYDFTVVARSREEALLRVNAMFWAKYVGSDVKTIPANMVSAWYVRLYCWIRNLFRKETEK